MAKPVLILLVVGAAVGGVYFYLNYEIRTEYVGGRAAGWKIVSRKAAAENPIGGGPPDASTGAVAPIRIATFNLGRFDDAKLANRRVGDVLLRLFPRFDLVAVQGVRGRNRGVLVRFVEQLNATAGPSGRNYDFATCPTQERDGVEHYSAFVFDRNRIDVDRTTVHFVEDRLNRFRTKPLVGLFRVRGPDPAEAFTFALINVETDPEHTPAELDLLAAAYRAVREDFRTEDDIILLGDLESDDQHLGQLGKLLGVSPLLSGVPTTVRGTQLLDNILLDRRATCEFTGRVEVVDMLRDFELTMPEASEVSEHLPVWAEFSAYEGGQAGHVAPPPSPRLQ
jgi:hypothetical protein